VYICVLQIQALKLALVQGLLFRLQVINISMHSGIIGMNFSKQNLGQIGRNLIYDLIRKVNRYRCRGSVFGF